MAGVNAKACCEAAAIRNRAAIKFMVVVAVVVVIIIRVVLWQYRGRVYSVTNLLLIHTQYTHGKMMNSDGGEDAYQRDEMRIEDAIVVVVVVEDSDAAVIGALLEQLYLYMQNRSCRQFVYPYPVV
jgi:hypothetical protein